MLEVIIFLIIAAIMTRRKEEPPPYSGPPMFDPATTRRYAQEREEMEQWRVERLNRRLKWTFYIILAISILAFIDKLIRYRRGW